MTIIPPAGSSLVVCSLEGWGDVRRRIRILVDELVDSDPYLEVLYVTPAVDVPFELRHARIRDIVRPRLEQVHPRIHVLRPRKWLPRMVGPQADRSLGRQVAHAVGSLGLVDPLAWVNDASYARFVLSTGWPVVYDVTDDWLLVPMDARRGARLRADDRLLLDNSGAVVVCSPELARSRGAGRAVDLIPNGVDVELFRTPQNRPAELPASPVVVYVGTLHEERVDVSLLVALADTRPDVAVVLVGPDSLGTTSREVLAQTPNIHLIGPVPYHRVPAFLQHADVVVIPHLVNPFTESLDPIKAYECVAAGRPTVATPVAGLRDLGPPFVICEPDRFASVVSTTLASASPPGTAVDTPDVPGWRQRAEAMDAVMQRVRAATETSR